MPRSFFVSDLHGDQDRYLKLFEIISREKPAAVFIGGDVLPSGLFAFTSNFAEPTYFVEEFFTKHLEQLKQKLGKLYPTIFLIMGNDDARIYESLFLEVEKKELITYVHNKCVNYSDYKVYGYSFVPPSPFMLKDWEKYDVSRYVDPGCVSPDEGSFTVEVNKKHLQYETIQKDLVLLTGEDDMSNAIFLFHTPPYNTKLDRAALDGKFVEHVPLDVHVGSIAVERFIKERQPLITLHGHIHESTSITGEWKETIGKTLAINAAHNGPELSLVQFDLKDLSQCSQELI